ncbi:MAG: helix-hairpin-helix domain-containing protein [Myxococcales bacterium]|nr:helix-hairpin-helix domain-containing protein [Myxococcales bacterium]MDP3505608.1 helix-hairpin-helix domain-containing protein [Myxococcales bacterium]
MKTATKVMAVVVVAFLAMSGEAFAAAKKAKTKLQVSGQVNLNNATRAQLDQLPGVGEKAATRIIEHRTKTPFTKTEDLMKVKGFGKKKFEKLKANLTVSGPTTLAVKRVSAGGSELPAASLPGAQEAQGRAPPARR